MALKISLDFDGTVTDHVEFFAALTSSMQAAGHLVGLLTLRQMPEREFVQNWLAKKKFPAFDFEIYYIPAAYPDHIAWKKATIEQCKIDYHFDDMGYDLESGLAASLRLPNVFHVQCSPPSKKPQPKQD